MSELNNLLNKMNKYMLINENISLFKKDNNDILNKKKITDVKTINIDKNFFYINKPDPLFWCFYIIKYGYDEYELNKNNSFTLEKNIKINSIEKLREKKNIIKTNKLKLNEIENELVNEKKISFSGFISLILINELNIMCIGDNTYYECINNVNNIFLIKYDTQINKVGLYNCSDTNDYINNIKKNNMQIFNIIKPLKAISSYKIKDLQEICNKLKINTKNNNKNIKKELLYQAILLKLNEDSINNIS